MSVSARCTPPEILMSGRATAEVTAIQEAWQLNVTQTETAPAHSALNLPAPTPNVSDSDANAYNNAQALGGRARDCVVLDVRYEVSFELVGGCPPYQASLETSGDVDSVQPCLPRKGVAVVSRSRIYRGDEFATRAPRRVRAKLSLVDCRGAKASCTLDLTV